MDIQKFDAFSRSLASGTPRRSVLKGMLGAALVAMTGSRAGSALAGASKTAICHSTGSTTNPWEYITVADAALPAHMGHGDGPFNSVNHCGACGNTCTDAPENGSPACVEGACGFTCNEGYEEIDGVCVALPYSCYWLYPDGSKWVPWPDAETYEACKQRDACSGCGSGTSGGGCYKWSTSSDFNAPVADFCEA